MSYLKYVCRTQHRQHYLKGRGKAWSGQDNDRNGENSGFYFTFCHWNFCKDLSHTMRLLVASQIDSIRSFSVKMKQVSLSASGYFAVQHIERLSKRLRQKSLPKCSRALHWSLDAVQITTIWYFYLPSLCNYFMESS